MFSIARDIMALRIVNPWKFSFRSQSGMGVNKRMSVCANTPGFGSKESEIKRKFNKIIFEYFEFCRENFHRSGKGSDAQLPITGNVKRNGIKRHSALLITG